MLRLSFCRNCVLNSPTDSWTRTTCSTRSSMFSPGIIGLSPEEGGMGKPPLKAREGAAPPKATDFLRDPTTHAGYMPKGTIKRGQIPARHVHSRVAPSSQRGSDPHVRQQRMDEQNVLCPWKGTPCSLSEEGRPAHAATGTAPETSKCRDQCARFDGHEVPTTRTFPETESRLVPPRSRAMGWGAETPGFRSTR